MTPARQCWWKGGLRLLLLVLVAYAMGSWLNRAAGELQQDPTPAGFSRGVLHGALMPMALPNLLVGRDVAIYAQNNIGVAYKLGYTVGVNGCGALFFGVLFWRVSRWRKRALAKE